MKDAKLMKHLGTAEELAAAVHAKTGVKVSRSAVYEWRRKGVPARWRTVVDELARQKRQDAN